MREDFWENQRLLTSFDPNDMGPSQKGSFWSHRTPVELESKLKKKNLFYAKLSTHILKDSSVRKNVQAMGLKYHFFYFIQALE